MDPVAIHTVTEGSGISLEFVLNFLGVVIALVAVIIFSGTKNKFGQRIESAIRFVIFGILFNMLGLVWDIVFMYTKGVPTVVEDAHPIFVIIGMVFFAVAAGKFLKGHQQL
jgi:membrane protease YdiL (CAAX protease family)